MKSDFPTQACYSQPFRLGEEELQNPDRVIACFFNAYHLSIAKQQLCNCVEVVLSTDNPFYTDAEDRADLLRFYHFVEELLEAAYAMKQYVH